MPKQSRGTITCPQCVKNKMVADAMMKRKRFTSLDLLKFNQNSTVQLHIQGQKFLERFMQNFETLTKTTIQIIGNSLLLT